MKVIQIQYIEFHLSSTEVPTIVDMGPKGYNLFIYTHTENIKYLWLNKISFGKVVLGRKYKTIHDSRWIWQGDNLSLYIYTTIFNNSDNSFQHVKLFEIQNKSYFVSIQLCKHPTRYKNYTRYKNNIRNWTYFKSSVIKEHK